MKRSAYFSIDAPVFHGKTMPQKGNIVGYGAIINSFDLQIPMSSPITMVSAKNNIEKENLLKKSYVVRN